MFIFYNTEPLHYNKKENMHLFTLLFYYIIIISIILYLIFNFHDLWYNKNIYSFGVCK